MKDKNAVMTEEEAKAQGVLEPVVDSMTMDEALNLGFDKNQAISPNDPDYKEIFK